MRRRKRPWRGRRYWVEELVGHPIDCQEFGEDEGWTKDEAERKDEKRYNARYAHIMHKIAKQVQVGGELGGAGGLGVLVCVLVGFVIAAVELAHELAVHVLVSGLPPCAKLPRRRASNTRRGCSWLRILRRSV